MPTERKRTQVSELQEVFSGSSMIIATNYQGINVAQMAQLRRRLREAGIDFMVVKNTLARLAAEEADRPSIVQIIDGPTAFAIGYGDPVEPARVLAEYVRSTRLPLEIRGAVVDGRVLSSSDVATLPTLPSREVLISQVMAGFQSPMVQMVWVLQSPLAGLVNTLNGVLNSLVWALDARRRQLEGES
jgi:large subunit ribosomal protein L10